MKLPINYDKATFKKRRLAREEYARRQKGKCQFCRIPLSKPPSIVVRKLPLRREHPKDFFKYPVHLHHNHITGLTIGAVHARCNAVLWEYLGE